MHIEIRPLIVTFDLDDADVADVSSLSLSLSLGAIARRSRQMASINRHLPSPGSAVWRRDISSRDGTGAGGADDNKVRHVVIRDAEIREQPSPHVVYRIDVLTEHDHWYIFHRYSHFYSLHKKVTR